MGLIIETKFYNNTNYSNNISNEKEGEEWFYEWNPRETSNAQYNFSPSAHGCSALLNVVMSPF